MTPHGTRPELLASCELASLIHRVCLITAAIGIDNADDEEMTLCYIRLRDYEGSMHYIPNGTIDSVTNRSRGFAFALFDIHVTTARTSTRVTQSCLRWLSACAPTLSWARKSWRISKSPGSTTGRTRQLSSADRFKVMPLEQWTVRRAFLYRLKKAFDAAGIGIPYPHLTL